MNGKRRQRDGLRRAAQIFTIGLFALSIHADGALAVEEGQIGVQVHIAGYRDNGYPLVDPSLKDVRVTSDPAGIDCQVSSGTCYSVFPDGYDPTAEFEFAPTLRLYVSVPEGSDLKVQWATFFLKGGRAPHDAWGDSLGQDVLAQGSLNPEYGGLSNVWWAADSALCTFEYPRLPANACAVRLPKNDSAALTEWGETFAFSRDRKGEPTAHVYVNVFKKHDVGRLDGEYKVAVKPKKNTLSPQASKSEVRRYWSFKSLCAGGTGPCKKIKLVRSLKHGHAAPVILRRASKNVWRGSVPRDGLGYGCQGSIWRGGKETISIEVGKAINSMVDPFKSGGSLFATKTHFGTLARGRAQGVRGEYTVQLSKFSKARSRTECGKALVSKFGLKVGERPRILYKATFLDAWL